MFDDEINSLFSLLGLLEPSEYFVTVDHSTLWQKHISWAKSGGEDLRSYITQRYASSMVFLSCLLAAQINVFFNSSTEITEMRAYLSTQRMSTMKYWIGVVIMTDICVTILALVNTYTLSKLIASISDSNAHAMLRSSIGSYVAVLPSRFTVAALYLFLLWIAMFIWELFTGPIHYFLILMVLLLFFHVIIPLSAFGRLIIHTGAMGRRPVLDVELEKELLPSGLHNSLLIRATDRKRKYNSSATDQYRKPTRSPRRTNGSGSIPSSNYYGTSLPHQQQGSSFTKVPHRPPRDIVLGKEDNDTDDLTMDGEEDPDLEGRPHPLHGDAGEGMVSSHDHVSPPLGGPSYHHQRRQTIDTVGSDNFFFPHAAILNATTRPKDIRNIVQQSMNLSASAADASVHGSSTLHSGGISMTSATSNDFATNHAPETTAPTRALQEKNGRAELLRTTSKSPIGRARTLSNSSLGRFASLGGGEGSVGGHRRFSSAGGGSVGGQQQQQQQQQHHRFPSSGAGSIGFVDAPIILIAPSSPASDLAVGPTVDRDDIHTSMRYPTSSLHLGQPRSFLLPTTTSTSSNVMHRRTSSLDAQQQWKRHSLLLDSPPGPLSSSRPPLGGKPKPIIHRSRSAASRRSSGSILGFLPLPSATANEWEEDNAIRASLNLPLAPDLEYQDRLLEEQMNHQEDCFHPPRSSSDMTGASTWWASLANLRRNSSTSSGNGRYTNGFEDTWRLTIPRGGGGIAARHPDYDVMVNNQEDDPPPPPPLPSRHHRTTGFDHRSSRTRRHSSALHPGYNEPASRSSNNNNKSNNNKNSNNHSSNNNNNNANHHSRRNYLMATIQSHPDEEKADKKEEEDQHLQQQQQQQQHDREIIIPEETTRLLHDSSGSGDSDGPFGRSSRRSYS